MAPQLPMAIPGNCQDNAASTAPALWETKLPGGGWERRAADGPPADVFFRLSGRGYGCVCWININYEESARTERWACLNSRRN